MQDQGVYAASIYLGPVVNLIHLLSMVLFMGALLIVDLRLLGTGLRQPLRDVARDARPWLLAGLAGLVLTGVPQLMDRALGQYVNSTFWMKMWLLAFGLIWTFTVRRAAIQRGEATGAFPKLVGAVSMVTWLGVASLARLIMLLPDNFWFAIQPPTTAALIP
jgi:hypothetical protein